jgi:transcriptional regulator with XRE-family HTH domain
METFGKLVQARRLEKGYSQRHLAKLVGVDYSYISKIENDRVLYPPKPAIIDRMTIHLELDSDALKDLLARTDREDINILRGLVKLYPKKMTLLLRRMHGDRDFAEKVFTESSKMI